MSQLRVQKYGGSSVESIEKIQAIASQVAKDYKSGDRFILVISAMGQATDDLKKMAQQISEAPDHRELDMLLTAGERMSISLMSMALNALGVPAISFTGSQAGILTNETHGDADILEVKPIRVEEEVKKGRVVVIAGFQGVSALTKDVTTLGRGGSDTTAVAFADYFGTSCEFKKDTEGIFKTDPNVDNTAEHCPELNYEQVIAQCQSGAPFLHLKAAELAQSKRVRLVLSHAHRPEGRQTVVEG